MPRKKKRVIDSVEAGNVNISYYLQESISETVSKLPQDFYLMLAKKPVQLAKWKLEKDFFKGVGQAMDAFFSGEAPPDFAELPKHKQDAIEYEVWFYLSFYSMVSANWKSVERSLEHEVCPSIPITEGSSIPECKFSDLDTPGKVLLKVIEYSAIRQMSFYFGELGKEESNYAKRKLAIDVQKSRRSDASSLLIQRVEEKLKEQHEADPCRRLESLCFLTSYRSGKKGRARETVRSHMKAGYAREDFEKKELHPQVRNRGLAKTA